jgi:hypothetical protein
MFTINADVLKALTMMGIALPTMFFVIFIIYISTKVLHKMFPAKPEADGDDED